MKKGTIKKFRNYLNKKYINTPLWKHNQFHQLKRGYGDYLYFQDKIMFNVVLSEVLQGNRPEYNDFLKEV